VESPLFRCVALCAEYPNDNPSLYREPVQSVRVPEAPEPAAQPEPEPLAELELEPIVQSEPLSESESVAESVSVSASESASESVSESVSEPVSVVAESGTDPTPPVLEADDETDDIEIVEDLVIENAVDEAQVDEAHVEEAPSMPPPAPDDAFDALVAVLEEVARGAGAADTSMQTLRVLLGRERIAPDAPPEHTSLRTAAAAWQAILRGESENFAACGASTLDEWCSMLVAAALGEPTRADSLRRELRRRGVAAFGLIVEAA
jgi:hypothetical protein